MATAAMLGGIIAYPSAPSRYVGTAADRARETAQIVKAAAEGAPFAERECAIGEPVFSAPFAPLDDVVSIKPLGGITARDEVLPAPYIRVNMRRADTAFERRKTTALAPARAEIVAVERRTDRDAYGRATARHYTVHFRACNDVAFYYDRIDRLSDALYDQLDGMANAYELGSPDHVALETRLRVAPGAVIGETDGFDIGLHDFSAPPADLDRPERYLKNPYARAVVFNAPESLLKTITPPTPQARCALDYLPKDLQEKWSSKLGDNWGIRRAKGEDPCRAAVADVEGAAQGAWFTDASYNAATTRVSAIALAPDNIDPDRLIFALHGRLASLTPDLVNLPPMMEDEMRAASKDFLSAEKGDGRINRAFSEITDDAVYCYERLRANFVGPRISGVLLLQRVQQPGETPWLKLEARGDVPSCIDLPEPWGFTGNETIFHR